ncbi:FAD-dependent monooxygenase [Chelatococcus reniformis]|uniref:Salicylate hydroxylase n=1 Tax=Chelatococcus reniformis TaxID=1494448 RepID=A0A916USR3_9HYPH|nr:FAD-dependent monooxygenase [Chelatococcus reniformis]GGC84898.1 salicylate hydroxylase [Chelatococcus reniformis]
MTDAARVIIAGAGIGGLTAALALAKVGIAAIVLERRTALNEAGAGIQLSPNASGILFGLGLGPALMRHAVEPARLTVHDLARGRRLAEAPLGAGMRERFGAPYLAIARSDLHTILLDAVRSRTDTRLLVGRTALGAVSRDDSVQVAIETAGGQRDTLGGALLIAADGVGSRLRSTVEPGARPRLHGYHAWRTTISAEAVPEGVPRKETGLWLGRGCHLVHYPVAAGRQMNIVAVQRAAEPVSGWTEAGDSRQLNRAFLRAAAPIRALVAQAADWRIWSLQDLSPLRRWHAGRIVLLGDAAHPVLPFLAQGGALAIEDAAVLAQCLASLPSTTTALDAALAFYTEARRERATRVQRAAQLNGRVYHLPAPLSIGRNLMMARLGGRLIDRYDWLYGWTPAELGDPSEHRIAAA